MVRMDIVVDMISFFWILLESLVVILICNAFLKPTRKPIFLILGAIGNSFVILLVCNRGYPDWFRMLFSVLMFLIMVRQLFDGKLLSQILPISIAFAMNTLTDVYFVNGLSVLLGIPYDELIWMKRTYTISVSLGKLLNVFVAWIVQYIKKPNTLGQIRSKWLLLILIFPITSLVLIYAVFVNVNRSDDVSVGIIIASLFLTTANVAILYIITALEKSTEREQDLRLLKQQMTIQADNLKAMELNYRTQRRVTHEFERHLQTIQNLLTSGEYETVEGYVSKLQKDRALRIVSVHSNHPVIDAILNQKHQLAQEGNIKMQIDVNDLSGVTIETDKLVILIANLLDNAIEACLRLEYNREIHCRIVLEDDLYISIRNTSAPVEIVDGNIASSKGKTSHHGYGLQAVRYVLAELNGEYTFDYSDGWFRFAGEIPQ